jgi:nickel/cobalt exporter
MADRPRSGSAGRHAVGRRTAALGALATLGALAGLAGAPVESASAHPSGEPFSVSQYGGLAFTPDQVRVAAAVHTGQIVTRQDRQTVDADRSGAVTDAERARYARTACADLANQFEVRVNGERLVWTVVPGDYRYEADAAGLPTAMLTCDLSAPAGLSTPATVSIANRHRLDQNGWRELTAVGSGVHIVDSPVPEHSVSDQLRAIPPPDALVLNVRTANLRIEPGAATARPPDPTVPATDGGLVAAGTTWAERRFEALATGRLTPLVVVLAVLLAVLLGAGHAALPGHGKTVLAAYLAGRRGRPRDALAIGATVTASHTGAVLLVGALISTSTAFAGDRLLAYLGVISGSLIIVVGIGMIGTAARRRAGQSHDHEHPHDHHTHTHAHGHSPRPGRLGLAGIGLAGGLVPSPSALVVLLASIGIGRATFGVLLVLAYGIGMAGTLTAAGLLLLALQGRIARSQGTPARLLARLRVAAPAVWPLLTPALVLAVGAGLVVRGGAGLF